eukprot:3602409-Prymnesium_polylepis.1
MDTGGACRSTHAFSGGRALVSNEAQAPIRSPVCEERHLSLCQRAEGGGEVRASKREGSRTEAFDDGSGCADTLG